MTTATLPAPARPSAGPRAKVWTVDEFHRFGDLGAFEGRRAMLIDGQIIEEGPMNPPHRIALEMTDAAVRAAFGPGWRFCGQMPLILGQTTDPEPDFAVVSGPVRGATAHPTTAALVIEVADSSLRFDLTEKMSLYAAGGIADYWVLDVAGARLVVHRGLRPDPAQRFGHGYAQVTEYGPADSVSPLAAPAAAVRVADLLP
jgi:Uma2 family endonuclease